MSRESDHLIGSAEIRPSSAFCLLGSTSRELSIVLCFFPCNIQEEERISHRPFFLAYPHQQHLFYLRTAAAVVLCRNVASSSSS
jgi:hypothetical protein